MKEILFTKIYRRKTQLQKKKPRAAARKNEKYKEMKRLLVNEVVRSPVDRSPDSVNIDLDLQPSAKKRKLLRTFREYTNPNDNGGKFKGWSIRAAKDMADLCTQLNMDTNKEKLLRAAYRMTFHKRNKPQSKKKNVDAVIDVDYATEIWGIPDIELVEI